MRPNVPKTQLRVLVVDDNKDAADTLAEMVRTLGGYEVKKCYGGADCLKLVENWWPDIVFCDLAMPQISGLDVAVALRKMQETKPKLKIVAVTAFDTTEFVQKSLAAGFDLHFAKTDIKSIVRLLTEEAV